MAHETLGGSQNNQGGLQQITESAPATVGLLEETVAPQAALAEALQTWSSLNQEILLAFREGGDNGVTQYMGSRIEAIKNRLREDQDYNPTNDISVLYSALSDALAELRGQIAQKRGNIANVFRRDIELLVGAIDVSNSSPDPEAQVRAALQQLVSSEVPVQSKQLPFRTGQVRNVTSVITKLESNQSNRVVFRQTDRDKAIGQLDSHLSSDRELQSQQASLSTLETGILLKLDEVLKPLIFEALEKKNPNGIRALDTRAIDWLLKVLAEVIAEPKRSTTDPDPVESLDFVMGSFYSTDVMAEDVQIDRKRDQVAKTVAAIIHDLAERLSDYKKMNEDRVANQGFAAAVRVTEQEITEKINATQSCIDLLTNLAEKHGVNITPRKIGLML